MKTYLQMDGDRLVEYVEKREYDLLAQERADFGALVDKLERELNAAVKALELIEDRFVDGENTYDDWLYMGTTARQFLAKIHNHLK